MRDYLEIFKRNLFSPIVIAIALLAGALIYVHEYRDAWFISVVIVVNSLIGIVQELRAKRALKKLELMSAPKARKIEGDVVVEVAYDALVVGDVIELLTGDEVPADAKLTKVRGLEVDESMLTGESLAVEKARSDMVYAATVVTAGSARATVVGVGAETKAGAMGQALKRYEPDMTPLQRSIQRIVSVLTFGAIGLAVVIAVVYLLLGHEPVKILQTIVSAAVTIVPEGLLLASSLLLAFGSLKLAQAKVLPQKLAAIEAMALLNLLCVDKTGTLTSDEIVFDRAASFGGMTEEEVTQVAGIVAREASGGNATGLALAAQLHGVEYAVQEVLPFSSARKMSGVRVALGTSVKTYFLGAPEYVGELVSMTKHVQRQIDEWTLSGRRVLLVVESKDAETPLKRVASGALLGAVVLDNPLRDGVKNTVEFLQNKGVSIRVISGDNPQTVAYIARQAGIEGAERVITGKELVDLGSVGFKKAADENTIFARVLPEQKEQLIEYFQEKGLFTGRVGDGVNDALALKKADLGVAMYAGATVSRRVADVVLLNNSFTALPMGMKLGSRVIQAIEIIATLFFHKIIYGVVLLLGTLLLGMTYPFMPRHITFMNIFLVSLPTVMWTIFPPMSPHRANPRNFWQDTLQAVAPIAVITGLTVTFTYWILSLVYPERTVQVATMTVLTATFFGVYMVFLTARMLGVTFNKTAKKARLLYLVAVMFVALTSFSFGFMRDFFDFSLPQVWILWPAVGVIALAAMGQWDLAKRARRRLDTRAKRDHLPKR